MRKSYVYSFKPFVYEVHRGVYKYKVDENFKDAINALFPQVVKSLSKYENSRILRFSILLKEATEIIEGSVVLKRLLNPIVTKFTHDVYELISMFLLFKLFRLEKIFPLMCDGMVNEIYIDGPGKKVYIDHALFGRLETNIEVTTRDIESLIFFIKIYGDSLLFGINPSQKIDLSIGNQKLRISIDSYRYGTASVVIRKLSALPPYLSLITHSTMRKILSILLGILIFRPNIIIFGETGSGKTTLASLLLSAIPASWRLVIIEDVSEIPDIMLKGKKAIRISVPSYELRSSLEEYDIRINYKEREILKLLHRSPDYCFITEIQDAKDTKALFHAYSAGIRGIATTHARDFMGLVRRWLQVYGLAPEWMDLVDVFIQMEKTITSSRIYRAIKAVYIPINNGKTGNEDHLNTVTLPLGGRDKKYFFVIDKGLFIDMEFPLENIARKIVPKFSTRNLCNADRFITLINRIQNILTSIGKIMYKSLGNDESMSQINVLEKISEIGGIIQFFLRC